MQCFDDYYNYVESKQKRKKHFDDEWGNQDDFKQQKKDKKKDYKKQYEKKREYD